MKCVVCGREAPASGRCTTCGAVAPSVATGVLTPLPPGPPPDDSLTRLPNLTSADATQAAFVATGAGASGAAVSGAGFATGAARAMAASGPFTTGQSFGPRYHIIRLLGVGGMGAVYQAWDDELGVAVAIKVIRPEAIADPAAAEQMERRFKRELLLARQVTHKNVVRIHDLGEIDGIKYITMPYVQGASLETILKREGRLPLVRALQMAKQVVAGLAAAHEVGVIHRDLKPANVMIDVEENALVTDFGIARSLSASTAQTKAAGIVGTLEFMAPEQARGEAVDQRADIYAFGLMFHDMLAGRRQATGENVVAELMERMQRAPASVRTHVPEVPEPVEAIIDRCLRPNPAERFQTTRELAKALDALDDDGWPRVGSGIHTRTRRVKWAAGAAIVVLLALAGAAVPLRNRLPWMRTKSSAAVGQPVTLAILPFRNASGDQTLDWLGVSLAEMLRSDIGQSSHLHTVSNDRVHQIMRDLRIPAESSLDPDTLRRLAEFTSAQTVLWGQYLRFGTEIRIDVTLEDLARQRSIPLKAQAPTEGGLLAAVGLLAQSVRETLSLSPDLVKELQANAFRPSSQSVAALRYYNEGLQLARQGKHSDALKSFEASTREDPEFALAASRLGQAYAALGYDNEAERFSRRAAELSGSLPMRERYEILASQARVENQPAKAIESYENLLKVAPDDAEVHFTLGSLYEDANTFDRAETHYARVLAQDPKNVDALLAMGRVAVKRGKAQDSLEYLNRALSLAIQLENDEERAAILQALGNAYNALNKNADALTHYQQSLAIKRRLGEKRGIAASLNAIAQIQRRLGETEAAITNYEEALNLQRDIGDKRGIGSTLINLGVVFEGRGRYDEALTRYKESLQVQREVHNARTEALCLNNIGNIYLFKGQYDDALTNFERALQLREKLKAPGDTAQTLYNLAETSINLGRHEEALSYDLRALEAYRAASDRRGAAIVAYSIGTLFDYQGRYGAALKSKAEALDTFKAIADQTSWMAEMLGGYGHTLTLAGRGDEAEQSVTQALEVARNLKNQGLVAQALGLQGERAYYHGDDKTARRLFDEARQVAVRASDRRIALIARANAARAALSDPSSAAASIAALNRLIDEADAAGLKYLSTECAIDVAETLIAHDAIRAHAQLERAIARAERLGARVLMARSHFLLATILRQSGKAAEARRHDLNVARILGEIRQDAGSDAVLRRADLARMASPPAAPIR